MQDPLKTPSAGWFVVVEGIDGSGKSTHLPFIQQCLSELGHQVVLTREPGGSVLAESIRELVLHSPMDGLTECLSVFAARRDHLLQTVWPALRQGQTVLCDRYLDSSWAYQGGRRRVDDGLLEQLSQSVEAGGAGPHLVIYFDLPASVAAQRRAKRDAQVQALDRFELEDVAFFERVRMGYQRAAARRDPKTVHWIDAEQPIESIQRKLKEILSRP
ncbi:MAG: dTMP kinase [Burkholderiaceae bacterium]